MTVSQGLVKVLFLLLLIQSVLSINFFEEDDEKRSRIMHHDLIRKEQLDITGSRRGLLQDFTPGSDINVGSNWCKLKTDGNNEKVTATVDVKDGCTPPSIKAVLDKVFSGSDLKQATKILDGEAFNVQSVELDKGSKLATIAAKARGPLRVFSYLQVGTYGDASLAQLKLTWPSSEKITLSNVAIDITGQSSLDRYKAETEITKPAGKTVFEITKLNTGSAKIVVFNIGKSFTIYPPGIAREEDNFDYNKIAQLQWEDMVGYGAFTVDDEFQIVLQHVTKDSHTAAFGFAGIMVKFVMSRFLDDQGNAGNPSGAFVIKFPQNKNIKEVIDPLLTFKNIRALPMLRRFADRPWCGMITSKATKFMEVDRIKSEMAFCFPEGTKQELKAGFNLLIQIKLQETLRDDCEATAEQVAQIPKIAALNCAITQQALKFDFPPDYKTPLKATIKCMGADGLSDLPFNLFNEEGKEPILQIQEFSYNPASPDIANSRPYFRVTFVFTLPAKYRTIPGTEIGLGPFKLHVQTNAQSPGWDVIGLTTIKLKGIEIHVQLGHKLGDKNWKFVMQIPSMTFQQVKDLFKEKTETGITTLDGFGIKNFALEWTFGGSTIVKLRGNPLLFGYDGAHLEGIYWKPKTPGPTYVENPDTGEKINADQPVNAFAVAVWFKKVNLDWIMRKILGEDKVSISWFSNMNAIVAVSNAVGVVKGGAYKKVETPEQSTAERSDVVHNLFKRSFNRMMQKANHSTLRRRRQFRPTQNEHSYQEIFVNPNEQLAQYAQSSPDEQFNFWQPQSTNVQNVQSRTTMQAFKRGTEKQKVPDEPAISFTIPGLSATTIRKGVTIVLTWKMPALTTACFDNDLCKWMVKNFGPGFNIQLIGYFHKKNLEITAKINFNVEVIKPNKLIFNGFLFRLRIGLNDPGIRLECSMAYNDPELTDNTLTFMGAIELGFTGKLVLEFAMGGMIKRPWKFDYLAFGNLLVSIGYSFGPVPLPSLQFGAEIWLGKLIENDPDNNKHAVKIQGFFGIDPNKPKDFWVYAKFNKLTILAFCEAFKLKCSIPKFIGNTGFPEGLTVSFAAAAKNIPAIGLNIPAGFFISGKINILGVEAWGKIIIQTTTFEIDIQMSKFNWVNGLVVVQRSKEDAEQGPICFIRASTQYFRVHIQGYASVLGINAETDIKIEESMMRFYVFGTMWPGLFDAGIDLQATYGNLRTISFKFIAKVQTSELVNKIREAIIAFCNKVGAAAKEAFEKADQKFAAAQAGLSSAKQTVAGWKNDVNAWKNKLEARYDGLERKKASMNTDCKANCPDVCMGFLRWNSKCWKIWGAWVGCPTWDSCFSKVADLICLAGCEISKVVTKSMVWFQQLGLKIGMAMGSIANGLLIATKGVLDVAKVVVKFAQNVKDFVGKAVQGALTGLKWLAEKSKLVFDLRKLELQATLDQKFTACVRFSIDCTVFGFEVKKDGEACLNIGFLNRMVSGVTDGDKAPKELNGITETTEKLEEAESKFEDVQNADKNMKETEAKTKQNVDEETAKKYNEEISRRRSSIPSPDMIDFIKKIPKRTTVPTSEEMKYIKAATDPVPDYEIKGEDTIEAFEKGAPWVAVDKFDPLGHGINPKIDATKTGTKRHLSFESDLTPCERIKKALVGYTDLTVGLIQTANSMKDHDDAQKVEKRSNQAKLMKIHNQIKALENRHNLTEQEREDAYFWYDKLNDGFQVYEKKSAIAMEKQESYALPIIRRQLNHLLHEEKGSSFLQYTDLMLENAMMGYKRSHVPTPQDVDGEKQLAAIKRDLVSIVMNNDVSLRRMKKKLNNVKRNIGSMVAYTHHCRNH